MQTAHELFLHELSDMLDAEQKLVDADMTPDVDIRTPRFSPDSLQIAFIKTQLGLRGEVSADHDPRKTCDGPAVAVHVPYSTALAS